MTRAPSPDTPPPSGDPVVRLRDGQGAMFGYGSLLSVSSMELTLGRPYAGRPVACALAGWRRSWDVVMPNTSFYAEEFGGELVPEHIIYLNVRPSPEDAVNGLLYVLEPADFEVFDRREWIYDRVRVTDALRGVSIEGGEAYVYVAKPEWHPAEGRPRAWAALRASYVAIVERGVSELGSDFRAAYERTTDPVPSALLFDDRKRTGSQPPLAAAPRP